MLSLTNKGPIPGLYPGPHPSLACTLALTHPWPSPIPGPHPSLALTHPWPVPWPSPLISALTECLVQYVVTASLERCCKIWDVRKALDRSLPLPTQNQCNPHSCEQLQALTL